MTLRWAKGGTAEITKLEGEIVTLRSTTSSPPGARLDATLEREQGPIAIKVKSHGSKKDGDGFVLTARLIEVNRDVRAVLASLVAGAVPENVPEEKP